MRKTNYVWAVAALLTSSLFTACNNEETLSGEGGLGDGTNAKFLVATTSKDASYLLSVNQINEGETTDVGNGLEVDNATHWLFYNNKYAYRLQYNQGNAGTSSSYLLNAEGKPKERNIKVEIQNRFTTYGIYGHQILTAAAGATAEKDAAGNPKYGVTFTLIDPELQTLSTETVSTENMLGNGEYCTLSGIVESGNKLYTAICPVGISKYGMAAGAVVKDPSLINTEGGVDGTQYPDHVWVAIYNGTSAEALKSPKIIQDNRISYATSRFKSQYYQTMDTDDEGNIYVFSSSYATNMSNDIQKTTKPSGVVRIKAGSEEFDTHYYVNLEETTLAGRAMYKVWHITGDYFLMQMYNEQTSDKSQTSPANKMGIFKANDPKFTWVEGLPALDRIGSLSKTTCVDNGKIYIAVVEKDVQPAIYEIDPITATAKKGMVITTGSIGAIGKLTY